MLDTQNIIKNYASVINWIRLLVMLTQRVGLATYVLIRAPSFKLQAPSSLSNKRQASSPVAQASSFKPQATSSKILDPRKSFTVQGPRASTRINELLGCLT